MPNISVEQSQINSLNLLTNNVAFYSYMIIINISIASNLLNIAVCTRKRLQVNMMGFYNIVMSLSNILWFVCAYLLYFPASIGAKDLAQYTTFSCFIIGYSTRVCAQMSSCINVMITMDRAICITFPLKFKFLSNKKLISSFLLALLVILCVINVPNLFYKLGNQTTVIANKTSNLTICGASHDIILSKYIIIIVMRDMVPITLTTTLDIVLIRKIFESRRSSHITKSLRKEYQFALTVVIMNCFLTLTETPYIWGRINMYLSNSEQINGVVTLLSRASAKLIFMITFMLATYMCGSLFFVNLCFNKIFQKEIRLLFGFATAIVEHENTTLIRSMVTRRTTKV